MFTTCVRASQHLVLAQPMEAIVMHTPGLRCEVMTFLSPIEPCNDPMCVRDTARLTLSFRNAWQQHARNCPGAVLPRGRQQHLRRRQAADDAQQRAERRPAHVRGARPDQPASIPPQRVISCQRAPACEDFRCMFLRLSTHSRARLCMFTVANHPGFAIPEWPCLL